VSHREWVRVSGPDLQPQHGERRLLNDKVLASENFLTACTKAGVEPTRRQARKFRRKTGRAFNGLRQKAGDVS